MLHTTDNDRRRNLKRLLRLALAITLVGLAIRPFVTGGGDTEDKNAHVNWVAAANKPTVAVYPEPNAPEPTHLLANPGANGSQLVFLADGHKKPTGEWVPVHLAVRPNFSKGWVRATDVELSSHDYSIEIALEDHNLTLRQGDDVVIDTPIAVGKGKTPTPTGFFYLKELLQPPKADGLYGPYAFGMSGFSDFPGARDFAGGTGEMGLHGTNDPDSLGDDVSHGCIRVSNKVITRLARTLPMGTPVQIVS